MKAIYQLRHLLIFAVATVLVALSPALNLWSLKHVALLLPLLLISLIVFGAYDIIYTLRKERFGETQQRSSAADGDENQKMDSSTAATSGSAVSPVTLIAIFALGALFFYLIRIKLFLSPPEGLGDSLQLIQNVPIFAALFGYLDSFDELLELYIHSRLYLFAKEWWELSIVQSYAITSALAGGLYLAALFNFLRNRKRRDWSLAAALLLFTPAIQLYAGYVENYTICVAVIALILFKSARSLEELSRPQPAAPPPTFWYTIGLLAALAVLLHLVAGFLLPALIYLCYRHAGGLNKSFFKNALRAGAPAAALLGVAWFYFLFAAEHTVSLADSHLAHPPYLPISRLISLNHLRDFINQLLLGAPLLFVILPPLLRRRWRGRRSVEKLEWLASSPVEKFLLIAALSFLADAFFHNPQLGFPADWDLFTIFQGPLNLYLFYAWRSENRARPLLNNLALLTLAAILTSAWLMRNAATDEKSRTNLVVAEQISNKLVPELQNDSIFNSTTDPTKRKLLVRLEIFRAYAHHDIASFNPAQKTELNAKLERALLQLREQLIRPDSNVREITASEAWRDLTAVNLRIQELKSER